MKVVYWGKARQFYKEHKTAEAPLRSWKRSVQDNDWNDFSELRQTFNSADYVDGLIVFDIKGNNFRLVTVCVFQGHRIYIKEVMTHEQYDKGNWKEKYKRF